MKISKISKTIVVESEFSHAIINAETPIKVNEILNKAYQKRDLEAFYDALVKSANSGINFITSESINLLYNLITTETKNIWTDDIMYLLLNEYSGSLNPIIKLTSICLSSPDFASIALLSKNTPLETTKTIIESNRLFVKASDFSHNDILKSVIRNLESGEPWNNEHSAIILLARLSQGNHSDKFLQEASKYNLSPKVYTLFLRASSNYITDSKLHNNLTSNKNWLIKYAECERILIEAGWKENIATSLLAAILMVFGGSTIKSAADHYNIKPEDLLKSLQDRPTIEKVQKMYEEQKDPYEMIQSQPEVQELKQPQKPKNPNIKTKLPQSISEIPFEQAYAFIKSNEGYSQKVYKDPAGNLAIGIGFNLDRPFVPQLLKQLGMNYKNIRNGKKILTDEEVRKLFQYDYNLAVNNAKQFITNFDQLPTNVKLVVIDMAYNMGPSRLSKFTRFKNALENNNYKTAAEEMKNSNWYTQVKSRAKKLIDMISAYV